MAKVLYLPQDMKDPQNHGRRIWFSCHPEDVALLDKIQADIRAVCDDVVFFYPDFSDGSVGYDHLDIVDDTHLFVIAVTRNLMSQPNDALDVEFKRAMDRNYTILPIVFDEAVLPEFNVVSRDRQAVCVTEPEYEEKLRRFLNDVLVKDELASRAREIFCRRIFVSYCREDRKHAEEIIRLIHQKDAYRRVAVWFDKYLPIGEQFEGVLIQKVEDCNVFFITLTPNLLGRENYVMRKEFLWAQDGEKPIIAVEMEKTAQAMDDPRFREAEQLVLIPLGSPQTAAKEIGNVLQDLLDLEKRSNTPETNYLLGMAYLNGIDVEFDRMYALDALTAAANGDCYEAIDQLIRMYEQGIGVERSGKMAIKWAKKAVEKRRGAFEAARKNMDALGISWNQGRLVLSPEKEQKLIRTVGRTSVAEEAEAQFHPAGKALWLAGDAYCHALQECARILRMECQYEQERTCFKKMDQVQAEVEKRFAGADYLKAKHISWQVEQAKVERILHGGEGVSKALLDRAWSVYKAKPQDRFVQLVFVQCAQEFAAGQLEKGNASWELEGLLQQCKKITEALLAENNGDWEARELQVLLLGSLSLCLSLLEALEQAHAVALACIDAVEERKRIKPANAYIDYQLPKVYRRLGDICRRRNEPEEARKWLWKTVELQKTLLTAAKGRRLPSDYFFGLYEIYAVALTELLQVSPGEKDMIQAEATAVLEMMDIDPNLQKVEKLMRYREQLCRLLER